jgi:hypothetical protein
MQNTQRGIQVHGFKERRPARWLVRRFEDCEFLATALVPKPCIDGYLPQPRPERPRCTQASNRPPGLHEGFLRQVISKRRIAAQST